MPAPQKVTLPKLPKHARYVRHTNRCYDWGTFGWLLLSGKVDPRQYRYYFFINCSVRGPFLPSYAQVSCCVLLIESGYDLGCSCGPFGARNQHRRRVTGPATL